MKTYEEIELLNTRLEAFDLGATFDEGCKKMKFKTLNDIIVTDPRELVNLDGFSYTWLGELTHFLSEKEALHLFQPPGGRPEEFYKKKKNNFFSDLFGN